MLIKIKSTRLRTSICTTRVKYALQEQVLLEKSKVCSAGASSARKEHSLYKKSTMCRARGKAALRTGV